MSERTFRRYPVVIAKAPGAAARVAKRVAAGFAPSQAFWRRSIDELDGADATTRAGRVGGVEAGVA